MSLTYQQDPRKYNLTKRLKRISQRFSPGYKQIRTLKEDYLGHVSNRIGTNKNLQIPTKMFTFGLKKVYPEEKLETLIPQTTLEIGFVKKLQTANNNFFAFRQVNATNVLPKHTTFLLGDSRKKKSLTSNLFEKSAIPRLFGLFFKQFHLPYELTRNLKNTLMRKRILQIEFLKSTEQQIYKKIANFKSLLTKLHFALKRGFRHSNSSKNDKKIERKRRKECLENISNARKSLFACYDELKTFNSKKKNIYGKGIDVYETQISFPEYGAISGQSMPAQFLKFPQENIEQIVGYSSQEINFFNLDKFAKGKIFQLKDDLHLINSAQQFLNQSKSLQNVLEKSDQNIKTLGNGGQNQFVDFFEGFRSQKILSKTAFNVYNFNTKSNRVLYRYMEILKQKFGDYSVDLAFRLDNYAKAHQKVRRPSKYKEMCVARQKIRLFYGQLTTKKMTRILKKAKTTFPHIFGLMERRLDVLLVRSNFCKNIFTAQHIVKAGQILVNNKVQRNCFYGIKCYDFVTFKSKQFEQYCKYLILTKLRLNKFIQPRVPYLIINYKLMYFYVRPIVDARNEVGFNAPLNHSFLSKY